MNKLINSILLLELNIQILLFLIHKKSSNLCKTFDLFIVKLLEQLNKILSQKRLLHQVKRRLTLIFEMFYIRECSESVIAPLF